MDLIILNDGLYHLVPVTKEMLANIKLFKDTVIYSEGDIADNFYVVLNGSVSQLVRNPIIDEWDWAMSIYKALVQWKRKDFDVKAHKAMLAYFFKKKIEADTK